MNPFPGLRPFRQEEDHLFFGREEQTMELLGTLANHRFVAVVGTSGSGKSSLVRCGLLSQILGGKMLQAGTTWEVAVTHPGADPFGHLADALLEADIYDAEEEDAKSRLLATLGRSHFGLVEAIRQADLGEGTNFLLVVDQFEEIFRFNRSGTEERERASEFVSMLLQAARQSEAPIYIVLTMRSDFIGDCAEFEDLAEAVNRGEYLIPRMTRDQFKQTIEGPVRVAGGGLSPRLMQRLLNDLGQQADQLPCLQHALMRTWDRALASRSGEPLDLEDYDAIGRMQEALSRHADEIFGGLASDDERSLCAGLFRAITVRESENRGIRRPQRLDRIAEILDREIEVILPVIEAYRRAGVTFLMPPEEVVLEAGTVIDISHESLMRVWERLRAWVEEEAQAVSIFHRIAESAVLHERGEAGWCHDPELAIALSWRDSSKPNLAWAAQYGGHLESALSYLDGSQEAAEQEERDREAARQRELKQAKALAETERMRAGERARAATRMKGPLAVAAVIAVIAVIASIMAWDASEKARLNEVAAKLSAKEASLSAEEALVAKETLRDEVYSADLRRISMNFEAGDLSEIQDLLTKQIPLPAQRDVRGLDWYYWYSALNKGKSEILKSARFAEVAPDQQWVALSDPYARAVRIIDAETHQVIRELSVGEDLVPGERANPMEVAISPDGSELAVMGPDFSIRRWETGTWEKLGANLVIESTPEMPLDRTVSGVFYPYGELCYSSDSTKLLAPLRFQRVLAWDLPSRQFKVALSNPFPADRFQIRAMAASPSENLLAVSFRAIGADEDHFKDSHLLLWNIDTWEEERRIETVEPIRALEFSPDGRWMAAGADSGLIQLFETKTFSSPTRKIEPVVDADVVWMSYSSNGTSLAVNYRGNSPICIFEVESGTMSHQIPSENRSWLRFVGNDSSVWLGGSTSAECFDLSEARNPERTEGTLRGIDWSYLSNGRLAWREYLGDALLGRGDTAYYYRNYDIHFETSPAPIRLYQVSERRSDSVWQGGESYTAHASSMNGNFLVALNASRQLRVWDVRTEQLMGETLLAKDERVSGCFGLTVSEDGRYVAWSRQEVTNPDRLVPHIWYTSETEIRTLPSERRAFFFAFRPGDAQLLGIRHDSNGNRGVGAWDLGESIRPSYWVGYGGPVIRMAHHDSRFSIAGHRAPILVNSETGFTEFWDFAGDGDLQASIAFSHDDRLLFSGESDGTIRMTDVDTGEYRIALPAQGGKLKTLVVDPEGRWLASKSEEEDLMIWHFGNEQSLSNDWMYQNRLLHHYVGAGAYEQGLELLRKLAGEANALDYDDYWFQEAALLLAVGEVEAFRELRRTLMSQITAESGRLQQRKMIALCLLYPGDEPVLEVATELIAMVNRGEFNMQWNRNRQAVLAFRKGRFEEALDLFDESQSGESEMFRALSYYHLGRTEEARRSLEKARALMTPIEKAFRNTGGGIRSFGRYFGMIVIAQLQAAERSIEGKVTSTF